MTARPTLSDFDFALPDGLIAQTPAALRRASRLLHVEGGRLTDHTFADLPSLVREGDLLVLNDTRVMRARVRGRRPSGGQVEMLVERIVAQDQAYVQMRASHLPKVGDEVRLEGGARAVMLSRDGRFFRVRFEGTGPIPDWLERHGEIPLPPYIARPAEREDDARYQTVYARVPGAVAAPTAGLHFDAAMLERLSGMGIAVAFVTLHIGAGTFQPVTTEDLSQHRMHSEWFSIPAATTGAVAAAHGRGGRVLAVGTTSLRALESACDASGGALRPGEAETTLFVTPGYRFRVVDRLLTNFHLPRSTLLMLVCAFAGYETIRAAYAHAVAQRYRFFSYGDAMLLERDPAAGPV